MKRPPEPTPEEQTRVANYWHWVEVTIRTQGFGDLPRPEQVNQELLDKVARWKTWRTLMDCRHTGGITIAGGSSEAEITCSDCGDPMTFLSQTQIEEMERKRDE